MEHRFKPGDKVILTGYSSILKQLSVFTVEETQQEYKYLFIRVTEDGSGTWYPASKFRHLTKKEALYYAD